MKISKEAKEKFMLDTILAQRSADYGSYKSNCEFTLKFFRKNINIVLSNTEINDLENAMAFYYIFMIGAKLARLNFNPKHADSKIDLAGYTRVYKESCDFRFSFTPLDLDIKDKKKNHIKFVEYVNKLLNG